jgi:hypothetical protein
VRAARQDGVVVQVGFDAVGQLKVLKSQEYSSDLCAQHNITLIAMKITINSVGHKPPIYA